MVVKSKRESTQNVRKKFSFRNYTKKCPEWDGFWELNLQVAEI